MVQIEEESADGVLPFAWFARCLRPVNKQGSCFSYQLRLRLIIPPRPDPLHSSRLFPYSLLLICWQVSLRFASLPCQAPCRPSRPKTRLQLLVGNFRLWWKMLPQCLPGSVSDVANRRWRHWWISCRIARLESGVPVPSPATPACLATAQIHFYIYLHKCLWWWCWPIVT